MNKLNQLANSQVPFVGVLFPKNERASARLKNGQKGGNSNWQGREIYGKRPKQSLLELLGVGPIHFNMLEFPKEKYYIILLLYKIK